MKKYIIFLLLYVVLVMVLIFSRYWLNRQPKKEKIYKKNNPNTIRQPKEYLYVGIGSLIIFGAIGLFFLLAPESMIANYEDGMRLLIFLIFLVICIPCIFIILIQVNWKIDISEDEFIFKNIWGKKRVYKFDTIKIKELSSCTRFYHGEKHIVGISMLQENWDALENAILSYKKNKST